MQAYIAVEINSKVPQKLHKNTITAQIEEVVENFLAEQTNAEYLNRVEEEREDCTECSIENNNSSKNSEVEATFAQQVVDNNPGNVDISSNAQGSANPNNFSLTLKNGKGNKMEEQIDVE